MVGGDDVNGMVHSGRVWFPGDPRHEALLQDELCNRNTCTLANSFVDAGFTVLMDTVVADRAELDYLHALMSPRPVRLVTLAQRDPEDQVGFDGHDELERDMRRDLSDAGWWFDTSALTSGEIAERVVDEAPSAPLPCVVAGMPGCAGCTTRRVPP